MMENPLSEEEWKAVFARQAAWLAMLGAYRANFLDGAQPPEHFDGLLRNFLEGHRDVVEESTRLGIVEVGPTFFGDPKISDICITPEGAASPLMLGAAKLDEAHGSLWRASRRAMPPASAPRPLDPAPKSKGDSGSMLMDAVEWGGITLCRLAKPFIEEESPDARKKRVAKQREASQKRREARDRGECDLDYNGNRRLEEKDYLGCQIACFIAIAAWALYALTQIGI